MKRRWMVALLALAACDAPQAASEPPLEVSSRDVDKPQPYVMIQHPAWTRDAVIYEINTRQFTKEGSLAAAQRELPRLKKLGVTILWLMPIHPIGQKARLGPLGSPYSVRDYLAVNPELGSMADLKRFVDAAHRLDMHVILDWVANHSARDNPLVAQHPDWYEKDQAGKFRPATWMDWSDIIDFDYSKPQMRRYMTEALKFWVREAGVDGFRADYAGGVPIQFWENARSELDQIKPVFMLAEWEYPEFHRKAFDATYAWKLVEAMKNVAGGRADTGALVGYFSWQDNAWPREAMKMAYTSNHDVNASEGTDKELFHAALPAMIAFTFAADTIPLIYNGQEAGNEKRLNFLTRDPIVWREDPMANFYTRLIRWKKENPALHNGQYGGQMIPIKTSIPKQIFSFVRRKDKNKVFAIFNFSAQSQNIEINDDLANGEYIDFETGNEVYIKKNTKIDMGAWEYKLLYSNR